MGNRDASKANTSAAIVRKVTGGFSVTLDTATPPASTVIDIRHFSGGWVKVPQTLAALAINWYGCDTETGTYVPIYFGGSAVSTTLPGSTACMAEIPAACWMYDYIKPQSSSDTDTIVVGLKT